MVDDGVCTPTHVNLNANMDRVTRYADYHVITESSGFGRTAAMRARHSHSIYTIPPYEAKKVKKVDFVI